MLTWCSIFQCEETPRLLADENDIGSKTVCVLHSWYIYPPLRLNIILALALCSLVFIIEKWRFVDGAWELGVYNLIMVSKSLLMRFIAQISVRFGCLRTSASQYSKFNQGGLARIRTLSKKQSHFNYCLFGQKDKGILANQHSIPSILIFKNHLNILNWIEEIRVD